MVEFCNCSFNWVEVDKFTNSCTYHNTIFDINSKCPFYKKPEFKTFASSGNAENIKSEKSLGFTSNSQVNTSNSQGVHISKRKYSKRAKSNIWERFHSYGVKFDAEVVWDYLFKFEEIRLNKYVSYKRIDLDTAIVKVFRKSILVTLRASKEIIDRSVKESEALAISMVDDVISRLPTSIKVSNRKVTNTHNAFVNHPFAKKEVQVSINNEKRFIFDNSKGNPEFEAIHPDFAITDSVAIEDDIVSLIDKGLSRDYLAHALNELIKDRYFHAENMKSHVEAIQTLSSTVKELKNQINKFMYIVMWIL
jgi:hypothetical protein